ncbi:MAG: universal stress protein [Chloroflexi bacterium]|nr:universal stress protein [Chloroflexota bacterium]
MYQKIVVPLDGSKLAESVFPHLEAVARGCSTEEVVLVSVTEHITGTVPTDYLVAEHITTIPVSIGKKQGQAQRYLARIARRLAKKGIKARTEVLIGDPAEEIISFVKKTDADLILMASHGRSGISRWTHGSVADRVFRASSVPVLMVRALPTPAQ